MCLLLRADAEQAWLAREVIPVLRQVEAQEQLGEQDTGAALAYLEAMWDQAKIRARETDAVHAELQGAPPAVASAPVLAEPGAWQAGSGVSLSTQAGRYLASVRVLRQLVAARIATVVPEAAAHIPELGEDDGELPCAPFAQADGCEPQAA